MDQQVGHAGQDQHTGHDQHAGHGGHGDHAARFRDRFWVSLAPAVGAVLMSLSTIVVALNAQLLRRLDLQQPEQRRGSP